MNLTHFVAIDGVPMPVRHPATGDILLDGQDQPITITLLGPDSPEHLALEQQKQNRILQQMAARRARGESDPYDPGTAEDIEADVTDMLVRCTKAWSGIGIDEDETPCTPDAARRLYTDPRTRFIRRQAKAFLEESANFFRSSARSSSPSPTASSV